MSTESARKLIEQGFIRDGVHVKDLAEALDFARQILSAIQGRCGWPIPKTEDLT